VRREAAATEAPEEALAPAAAPAVAGAGRPGRTPAPPRPQGGRPPIAPNAPDPRPPPPPPRLPTPKTPPQHKPSLRLQTDHRVFELLELLSPHGGPGPAPPAPAGAALAAGSPPVAGGRPGGLPLLLELTGRLEQVCVLPSGPCHPFLGSPQ
jgi:hypothetical protein